MLKSNSEPPLGWEVLRLVLWFTLGTGLLAFLGIWIGDQSHTKMRSLFSPFLIAGTFTVCILGLSVPVWKVLLHRFPPDTRSRIAVHGVTMVGVMVLGFVLANFVVTWHMKVLFQYAWTREDVLMSFMITLIGTLGGSFSYYGNYYYRRSVEAQQAAAEAQLQALRAQINPHFLFNALNTIAAMTRLAPHKAEAVTEDLAELFRYSLQTGELRTVPLHDELEVVHLYMRIEKARFEERLHLDVDVPHALRSHPVLAFMLQPLVENAVKHGMGRSEHVCVVRVAGWREGDALHLAVTNTGPGFDTTDLPTLTQRGIGLRNIQRRMEVHYGPRAQMHVLSNGIHLLLPAL